MAAALRRALVLELDCAGARLLQRLDRVGDVQSIAKTGIGVDDQRQIDNTSDRHRMLDELGQIHKPEVGQAEMHVRQAGAGEIDRLEPKIRNDAGG